MCGHISVLSISILVILWKVNICRNPYMPAEKVGKAKARPSRLQQEMDAITLDKLALEICEIMGEANEHSKTQSFQSLAD